MSESVAISRQLRHADEHDPSGSGATPADFHIWSGFSGLGDGSDLTLSS